jgi:hypothetical protein
MMLGMREKSKVKRENGTDRRRRRRSPTEKGNELSNRMTSTLLARLSWSCFR